MHEDFGISLLLLSKIGQKKLKSWRIIFILSFRYTYLSPIIYPRRGVEDG